MVNNAYKFMNIYGYLNLYLKYFHKLIIKKLVYNQ